MSAQDPCPTGLSRDAKTGLCQSGDQNYLEQLVESPTGCQWRCAARGVGVPATDLATAGKFMRCSQTHGIADDILLTAQGVADTLAISAPNCVPNAQHGCISTPADQYAIDYTGNIVACPAIAPATPVVAGNWLSTHKPLAIAVGVGVVLVAILAFGGKKTTPNRRRRRYSRA